MNSQQTQSSFVRNPPIIYQNFLNNLSIKKDTENLIWIYEEQNGLYNKHSQYIINNENNIEENVKEIVVEKVVENVEEIKEEVVEEIKEEIKEEVKEEVKEEEVKEKVKEKIINKKVKKNIIQPFDIIIEYSKSNIVAKDYIKNKLIETIARKDYIKIFGLKKSSEIMAGITKEKWNKSLVIFISFLFDKEIIYKGSKIIYNVDKKNGTINLDI